MSEKLFDNNIVKLQSSVCSWQFQLANDQFKDHFFLIYFLFCFVEAGIVSLPGNIPRRLRWTVLFIGVTTDENVGVCRTCNHLEQMALIKQKILEKCGELGPKCCLINKKLHTKRDTSSV